MDDIKVYATSEQDIESLIHIIRIYSIDIDMPFGLVKMYLKDIKERRDDHSWRGWITKSQYSRCSEHLQIPQEPCRQMEIMKGMQGSQPQSSNYVE